MNTTNSKPRVLVVGGGFGGVKAALELSKSGQFAVTLLSDRPNFHYYPTLYHTATGGAVKQSCIPLNEIFADHDITLTQGSAKHLDRERKVITDTEGNTHPFDTLIMALGVTTNYFGIQGMEEFSHSIKSPEAALRFKSHLHDQLTASHKPDLNYVIIGGGPTGVELAGAMASYMRDIMATHGIKHRAIHIDLVEAAPRLLPRSPKAISKAVTKRLRSLGIKIYTNSAVQGVSADELTINGKPLQSHTVVWTAGVANHSFFKENGFALNERGKVTVNEYLEAEKDIYVLGDNADTMYSGVAQTALHDAVFVAHNLLREKEGALIERYVPREPIYVFPVGTRWAAVQWGKVNLYGLVGWLLRNAADFVGYKDIEPWWRAAVQWTTEFQDEETCTTCVQVRAHG